MFFKTAEDYSAWAAGQQREREVSHRRVRTVVDRQGLIANMRRVLTDAERARPDYFNAYAFDVDELATLMADFLIGHPR